jgi:hypothetical protein
MAKSGRQHAPRDRKHPVAFPKPPCTPEPPRHPPAPRPSGPGEVPIPDPRRLLDKLTRKR